MRRILNTDVLGKYALQGYDPVAFHSVGRAVKANPYISAEYAGYNFLFASEKNRDLFSENPDRFMPAFGGYCAFGVSLGVFFPVEIDTWEIINGKLIFNYSKGISEKFHENLEENMKRAETNWSETMKEIPDAAGGGFN